MLNRKTIRARAPRLPIKLCPTTNAAHEPLPSPPILRRVQELAHARAEENAHRLGISRRRFLASSCGAATALGALNLAGCGGGRYAVGSEEELDEAAARETLAGDELIFDVQTHHVAVDRPWRETDEPNISSFLKDQPGADCGAGSWVECSRATLTTRRSSSSATPQLACLSALWRAKEHNPLQAAEARRRAIASPSCPEASRTRCPTTPENGCRRATTPALSLLRSLPYSSSSSCQNCIAA